MAVRKTPSGGSKSDKPWRDAILLAVNEKTPENERKLRALAQRLVREAMGGDVAALKEIGDRLDGKPKQQVAVAGDAENPEPIRTIQRVIVGQ